MKKKHNRKKYKQTDTRKQTVLGVIGGSGFLFIIKGVGGLIESIFERPSAQWRTSITIGDIFMYLIVILAAMFIVNRLTSQRIQKNKKYWILGSTVVTLLLLFIFTIIVPFFQTILIGIHPMILVLIGAVLLPASGNLSLRIEDDD